ncbi:hypothetical protein EJ02DRAFT_457865 [Clathrospora elynae]|uniref:GPI anchored protein n=1 Tax=Clathrospora elynae TaxID=706981 RepID=A0A6A5SGG8_9PLEO|nr:hypothetical protein EJ02DRAFT_457865 [Clathrospora elynae]
MLAPIAISTLLLLASAAAAQDTPPVVTSPTPASESLYTIQTSDPTDPWSCYEVCVQSPCAASCASSGMIPIPPGETPFPVSESVVSNTTDPLLPSATGVMSIPQGETPISTGTLDTSAISNVTVSPTLSPSSSTTSAASPDKSTNAAAPVFEGHGLPVVAAIAGAAFALI